MTEINGKTREIFETLCKAFEILKLKYEKSEEELSVKCTVHGEDLIMNLDVSVYGDRSLVILTSKLPFVVREDKRVDMAIAVSGINYVLADGCFDFDITDGNIYFRMTNSFIDSEISEDVFVYLLLISSRIIDEYNDKFLMLSKGVLSVEQLLDFITD